MGRQLNKFKLLMWKNWTLLKRRPIHTAFEIIYPILICLILVSIRTQIGVTQEEGKLYSPFSPDNEPSDFCLRITPEQNLIAYSPGSVLLDTAMETLRRDINTTCGTVVRLQNFTSADSLNDNIDQDSTFAEKLVGAIIFNDELESAITLPKQFDLRITIRLPTVVKSGSEESQRFEWCTNFLFPVFQTPGPRNPGSSTGDTPDYVGRGFIYLQKKLATTLFNDKMDIMINRFPYPPWLNDIFYSSSLETMVSLMVMISFMYNYINTIRAITTEKEKQLKESMKIMGLPGWLHWTAWFLRSFIILFIAIVLIVIALKIEFAKAPVFTHSDPSVLLIFFLLFASATITFTFLISVFFSKANTASAVGSFVFFLTYLPYTLQQQGDTATISSGAAIGSSLLANSGLAFGLSVIMKMEAIEEGTQWSNLWTSSSPDNDLTLGSIMLILFIDIFLYLFLALYVEAIFPGEFGVPEVWYFPFTKSYWCGKPINMANEKPIKNQGEYFEDFTQNIPIGIQLQNLTKTFGSNKAVKNLNLDMYEGHITVLLGHNGAGKTTTMSMITGMFPPTSGTAVVGGYDVRTNIQNVRDSMGLCLQHNVLFDNLTVYEHLYFFGTLKGLTAGEIQQEINTYISLLELEDKRHAKSSTLSGGMKRKLSVGAALCGKSKVVMLDEPTAGMDPSARRAIWNLLQKQKQGRTILLTTHFMDEADLLGDRIAIMTGGQLQCCGSSFFLKRKYGAGYYLIMDITNRCNPTNVTNLLKKYIPTIEVYSHVGSELTYQLSEQDAKKFEQMLGDLERSSSHLDVQSYGVSLTTLEEVFMKVGADQHNKSSKMHNKTQETSTIINLTPSGLSHLIGYRLMKNQFMAMFLKRVLSIWRTWYLYALQIILPIALLVVTILNSRGLQSLSKFPSLTMSLDPYSEPTTLVEEGNPLSVHYIAVLGDHSVEQVSNVNNSIYQLTEDSPGNVKRHYLVGASFIDKNATAWFNGDPFHTIPLSLGLVLNAYYHQTGRSIEFSNYPLPLTIDSQLDTLNYINMMGFQIAIELGYGMAFVAAFYILFYIKERVSKSKHLQFVSGANVFIFWGTNLLCDLSMYLLTACCMLATFAALQEDGYRTSEELGRIFLVLLSFGFFVLPFIYLASYLFNIPSTGFSRIMLIGAVAGMIGVVAMQVLEIKPLNLMNVARGLNWVLLFIPFYSIAKAAYDLGALYNTKELCAKAPTMEMACASNEMCCDLNDYFAMTTPGIGRNVIISFIMCFVLLGIIIINEYGFFTSMFNRMKKQSKPLTDTNSLEVDVQRETAKIRNTSDRDLTRVYALVLRDVTKYYKNFRAVNSLCLGVEKGECFGLLGVNGAGKTSTFKMMTADEQISYGDAWVNGLNIKTDQKKVQRLIGYCPQFDALLDDLTTRETLKIFALIRGVPSDSCNELITHLAHEFDFYKHLDKLVKELSGGNKRKLSTALALIGDPPVIYLDEPTTGMDPATKRFLWTALAKLRDAGKCIILTSHSMEECEALCTRIAIMVNGSFQCLGSSQRLKNKFAQGFSLTIKIKKIDDITHLENQLSLINNFVQTSFPGAHLKEKYQELLSYQLTNNSMPWSTMFGILERNKQHLHIEDYALGQCSLEQVFLSFTKHQT